eukprot:COSAG05_NODE_345_length_10977_cov_17.229178_7_plen_488_part_00
MLSRFLTALRALICLLQLFLVAVPVVLPRGAAGGAEQQQQQKQVERSCPPGRQADGAIEPLRPGYERANQAASLCLSKYASASATTLTTGTTAATSEELDVYWAQARAMSASRVDSGQVRDDITKQVFAAFAYGAARQQRALDPASTARLRGQLPGKLLQRLINDGRIEEGAEILLSMYYLGLGRSPTAAAGIAYLLGAQDRETGCWRDSGEGSSFFATVVVAQVLRVAFERACFYSTTITADNCSSHSSHNDTSFTATTTITRHGTEESSLQLFDDFLNSTEVSLLNSLGQRLIAAGHGVSKGYMTRVQLTRRSVRRQLQQDSDSASPQRVAEVAVLAMLSRRVAALTGIPQHPDEHVFWVAQTSHTRLGLPHHDLNKAPYRAQTMLIFLSDQPAVTTHAGKILSLYDELPDPPLTHSRTSKHLNSLSLYGVFAGGGSGSGGLQFPCFGGPSQRGDEGLCNALVNGFHAVHYPPTLLQPGFSATHW